LGAADPLQEDLPLQDDLPPALPAGAAAPPPPLHELLPPAAAGSLAPGEAAAPPPHATADPAIIPATAETAKAFAMFMEISLFVGTNYARA
jgi:hypothetical protein